MANRNDTYRGNALINALRRAVHPATGDPERLNALRLVQKMDSEGRFLLQIDPELQRYHTADEWRLRVARLADQIIERDAKIRLLERDLDKERRKTSELSNLKAHIRELEKELRSTVGRGTIQLPLPKADNNDQHHKTVEFETGLPFKLFQSKVIECRIGEVVWKNCHWTKIMEDMITRLIRDGMSIEDIKENHFSGIYPGNNTTTSNDKKKYKYYENENVTIRRKDANDSFGDLLKFAAHSKAYFSVIVKFNDDTRIKQSVGSGEHINNPAYPGQSIEIVQEVGCNTIYRIITPVDGRQNKQDSWSDEEKQFLIDTIRQNRGITDIELAQRCEEKFREINGRKRVPHNTIKGVIAQLRDSGRLPRGGRQKFWDGSFEYI